jgi:hypothetical protein
MNKTVQYIKGFGLLFLIMLGSLSLWVVFGWCVHAVMGWVGVW